MASTARGIMLRCAVKAGQVYTAPAPYVGVKYVLIEQVRDFKAKDIECMPYALARQITADGKRLTGRNVHGMPKGKTFRIQLTWVEDVAVLFSGYTLFKERS